MKNYGLKFDEFSADHYFLGGGFLGTKEINPNGDWTAFTPLPEYQNVNGFETQACTIFATLNCLEILASFVLHEDWNKSDRFLAIISGASKSGNSPQIVIEQARKLGIIDDTEMPFDKNIATEDMFYSPNPMTQNYFNKAKDFLKNYQIGHEWVYPIGQVKDIKEQQALITQALKRSPVGMSVSAWHDDGKGGYDQQWSENHWVCCISEEKDYYHIYDSYDQCMKKYSKNSKITMAKIYTIKKLTVEDKESAFTKLINWIMSMISKETTPTTVKPITPVNNETKVEVKKSDLKIGIFCLALQKTEGFFAPGPAFPKGSRSWRNNNPGCLALRDAMGLTTKTDDIGLAVFATYKDGFMALKNKIQNICEGKSTRYSPEDSILKFCQTYSPSSVPGNYPENKAKIIAKELGVDITFKIKNLIA